MLRIIFPLYSGLVYLVFLAVFVWGVAFGGDFDPAQNFFGLKADQVTLRWGNDLGSGTGVQAGFKLGMDKSKKLVKGGGAGVTAADGRQMAQDYSWSFRAEARNIFLPLVRR